MKLLRNTVLAVAVATLIAVPLIGGRVTTTSAVAKASDSKVNYAPISEGDYSIDPAHSIIGFAIRHLEINWVEGRFKDFTGVIHFDEKDVTRSTVEFSAKVESIDTGVEPRNKHLRTPDFFDVEKYPTITFKSTKVEQAEPGKLKVTGDLTIHGVTKPVVLDVEGPTAAVKDPWGNQRAAANATTKINRQDFGVKWNATMDGGGLVVGDDVAITIDVEMVQKPATKPGN